MIKWRDLWYGKCTRGYGDNMTIYILQRGVENTKRSDVQGIAPTEKNRYIDRILKQRNMMKAW